LALSTRLRQFLIYKAVISDWDSGHCACLPVWDSTEMKGRLIGD
jgi:hypothetical protein